MIYFHGEYDLRSQRTYSIFTENMISIFGHHILLKRRF